MMVTLVSQFQKKAMTRPRRVLDSFVVIHGKTRRHKALDFMFDQVKSIALSHHETKGAEITQ